MTRWTGLYLLFSIARAIQSFNITNNFIPKEITRKNVTSNEMIQPPCQYYERMIKNCNDPLPHNIPYNTTHSFKCGIEENNNCSTVNKQIEFTLSRTSWWHCNGKLSTCIHRLTRDITTNLQSNECSSGGCLNHTLPGHIANLRELAQRLWTLDTASSNSSIKANFKDYKSDSNSDYRLDSNSDYKSDSNPDYRPDSNPDYKSDLSFNITNVKERPLDSSKDCTLKFDGLMELMANVIIQKCRFCRLDIESFARLIQLLNFKIHRYRCCTKQKSTRAANHAGNSSYYSYSYSTTPVVQVERNTNRQIVKGTTQQTQHYQLSSSNKQSQQQTVKKSGSSRSIQKSSSARV